MAIPQGITLEQLERIRKANSLTGWSTTTTNNQYGAQEEGLNQQNRGQAGSLNSVIAANNRYLQSGNITNDIQHYYDNYAKDYTDINDFINYYNSNIDTLNSSWDTNPLHYNAGGWRNHNQLYRKMYNSRSIAGGDIGYSDKLEDLLGSSTWLRNADHYDKAWTDLTDEEKAARTHTITIGDKQYKVGKDQYGHLVKIEDPVAETITPTPTPKVENKPGLQFTDYDIRQYITPEKPKFQWHDWAVHGLNFLGDSGTAATKYYNNSLLRTPLLQGTDLIHKDTSNYFQRATLENNNNKTLSQAAQVASSISDPTQREAVLQQAYESSLQNTLAQNQEFSKANKWNVYNATKIANLNKETKNEIDNKNHQSNVAAYNALITNRNQFATEKNAAFKDWATKTNDSYKEAVKGYRQNLQNIDIETAKFNNYVDLYNLQQKYNADVFNATYNKDNIKDQLWNIYQGKISSNNDAPTVFNTHYANYLTQQDLTQLWSTLNNLENNNQLSVQDKALIDKIIAIDTDYNKSQFSNLNTLKAQLKDQYDLDKLNLQLSLKDYIARQNILLSDQGFIPGRYKKGGKVDTSIINNAFKNFQKEQESARKNSVENAKLRLSKLEKELDRIHEKQIFLLKQIYK